MTERLPDEGMMNRFWLVLANVKDCVTVKFSPFRSVILETIGSIGLVELGQN